jgi:hypothetical protein
LEELPEVLELLPLSLGNDEGRVGAGTSILGVGTEIFTSGADGAAGSEDGTLIIVGVEGF